MENKMNLTNDSLMKRSFQNMQGTSTYIDNRLTLPPTKQECGQITRDDKDLHLKLGYETLAEDPFHMTTDRANTFHNYPVQNEEDVFCSMNHQAFNNMTRRKVAFTPADREQNVEKIIPDEKFAGENFKLNRCEIFPKK